MQDPTQQGLSPEDPEPRAGLPAACSGLLDDGFARMARQHPQAVAVEIPGPSENVTLPYAELWQRSEALAQRLAERTAPEEVVALAWPRSRPELYVALLAVLRSGCAYTYLDASFPPERARQILEDADVRWVLGAAADSALELPGGAAWWPAEAANPPAAQTPRRARQTSDLAYLIYTSGSTGRPKGVEIEHRSIANLIASDEAKFGLGPGARIAQGSSWAYDSSVEELWMAWSVAATAVILDDEVMRLGPDLVPWLRAQRIHVLCPTPTLLRTMHCADPSRELPEMELVYIGGESLPRDLADLWGAALHLENGYGPTECSVTAIRGRIRPGEPITIGQPVPGNQAFALGLDGQPVSPGAEGELCLAGAGLARGYRNLPQETAAKFGTHPAFGRFYRTGDWARQESDGNWSYLGRIDGQVKLRGYRIELEEIESHVRAHPSVRACGCGLVGTGAAAQLVAWVVPELGAGDVSIEAVQAELRKKVPNYMVPSHWQVIAELPKTVGGKLDRRALVDRFVPAASAAAEGAQASQEPSDWEARYAAEPELLAMLQAMQGVLPPGAPLDADADFFLDLGGHSLAAATLISDLRKLPGGQHLNVRDVYAQRTARGLAATRAERMAQAGAQQGQADASIETEPALPGWATVLQTVWLAASFGGAVALAYAAFFWILPWGLPEVGILVSLALLPALGVLAPWLWLVPSLCLVRLAKAVLIGKYRLGRVQIYGPGYVRHWILQRLASSIPWGALQGTAAQGFALRFLGARIGRNVHFHRGVGFPLGGWDLLEIGDDVTLSQDAQIRPVELRAGHWEMDFVSIGARSTVRTRAGMSPGARLGEDGVLESHAWLPGDAEVPGGQVWDGIPARRCAAQTQWAGRLFSDKACEPWSPVKHVLVLLGTRCLLAYALWVPLLAVLFWATRLWDAEQVLAWLYDPPAHQWPWAVLGWAALVPVQVALRAVLIRILGPITPGEYALRSWTGIRAWCKGDQLAAASRWLSGSLFWPPWLRLAGMRIGRNSEISTIVDCLPERVSIGSETFFADGIYLAGPDLHLGRMRVAETRIGDRVFLGNHAVIPSGAQVPGDVLLGVCTVANVNEGAPTIEPGTSWFGHPRFELPQREVAPMDRSLTHSPSLARRLHRLGWETLRFVLPIAPAALGLFWLSWVAAAQSAQAGAWFWWAMYPLGSLFLLASLPLGVCALKWVLLGRVRAGQHGLWSGWCCRWDFLYMVWNQYARGPLMALQGTVFTAVYLRLMGSRIGKRVALDAGFAQVVDPDMLEFRTGSSVSGLFQAHTFEDRVLKIAPLTIHEGATLGSSALVFYGADIGPGAEVLPQAVIMKGEHLSPAARYAGSPTQPLT